MCVCIHLEPCLDDAGPDLKPAGVGEMKGTEAGKVVLWASETMPLMMPTLISLLPEGFREMQAIEASTVALSCLHP